MRELVEAAYTRARALLEANREVLERSAGALLEHETLTEEDLGAFAAELHGEQPHAAA